MSICYNPLISFGGSSVPLHAHNPVKHAQLIVQQTEKNSLALLPAGEASATPPRITAAVQQVSLPAATTLSEVDFVGSK